MNYGECRICYRVLPVLEMYDYLDSDGYGCAYEVFYCPECYRKTFGEEEE